MQRITLLFMTAAMLGGGIVAAIEGCSSSDTTATPSSSSSSSSSSGDDGTSGNTDPGSSSSSSSSSSGTVIFDSGPITTVGVANPGQYSCGTVVCDAGGSDNNPNVCCQRPTNQTGTACVVSNNCNNEGVDASLQLICDESADCPQSGQTPQQQVCCYQKGDPQSTNHATFSTQCSRVSNCLNQVDFATAAPVVCKSNADCADAGVDSGTAGTAAVCNPKSCDGFTISVCGTPVGCQ